MRNRLRFPAASRMLASVPLLLAPVLAHATVLTFDVDPPVVGHELINQTYGDNVTATTMPGNLLYGEAGEGFTPNVSVQYGPAGAAPALWPTAYGDLSNILFKDADGFATLQVTLTAEPGFVVRLHDFDMAAYNPNFTGDPSINYVCVLDGGNNELFRQNNALISEAAHTSFAFQTPLSGASLTIEFDSINLGGFSDDIALDNIRFSQQVVPLPAAAWLLGSGLLGLLGIARRRAA